MVYYVIEKGVITVIVNGQYHEVPKTEENRKEIVKIAERNDTEAAIDLVESSDGLRQVLDADDRIVRDYDTGRVYLTGTDRPIPQALADRILSFLEDDLPVGSLIKFWKWCLLNPSIDSVTQLFDFLDQTGMPITKDGYFIGYRRVEIAPYYVKDEDGNAKKVGHSLRKDIRDDAEQPYVTKERTIDPDTGEEITEEVPINEKLRLVDGWTGSMDNSVGQTPSMPREDVVHNPSTACAEGLHIASLSYIPNYGGNGVITPPEDTHWSEMSNRETFEYLKKQDNDPITVNLVNPADVVSVPYAHTANKMRVCKFHVLALFNGEDYTGAFADVDYVDERAEELLTELNEQIEEEDADLEELRNKQKILSEIS